jgi:V/A-type H+-transporting ATPase subunit A
VTSHTKRYVRCFWGLDRERAQARFYPAIHPLQSYSEDAAILASWWKAKGNPDWAPQRQRLLTLLEEQARLERMARIVGKDALPPTQQVLLLCADLVNEGFLRQSAMSPVDRYCSPARQTAMLRIIVRFIDLAERAIGDGAPPDDIAALPILRVLQRMGEEIGEEQVDRIRPLWRQLENEFAALAGSRAHAG